MNESTRRALWLGTATVGAAAALALALLPGTLAEPPPHDAASSATPPAAAPTVADLPPTSLATASVGEPTPYVHDRIMVRPDGRYTAADLAAMVGASIHREAGRSGFAVLALPDGTDAATALTELRLAGLAERALPLGRTAGASDDDDDSSDDASDDDSADEGCGGYAGGDRLRWHNAQSHHDYLYTHRLHHSSFTADMGTVTVALLDTGVAYETNTADGTTYARAGSLTDTAFVHPYDFVNDDAHPNDDHMHGTHIASLIASGGGSSQVAGVAPGVTLMPIKVLDEQNEGTEWELIEGLWHAIDHDADIINLSLTMAPGYVPSLALQEALAEAANQEIFMVGAAGNDALDAVSWPAASPYVIAVSSSCFDGSLAPYTNRGPEVALTAYGGCMNQDVNRDGRPDGLLAETIVEGDPSQTQLAYWGGTSQSAAIATGIAATLLADGVPKSNLRAGLQMATNWRKRDFANGAGAGLLWADLAQYVLAYVDHWATPRVHVAVLPYLKASGDRVYPAARISVVDSNDVPYDNATAWVRLRGETEEVASCRVYNGTCTWVGSEPVTDGGTAEFAWTVEVAAVVDYDVPLIIEPALFATDGLEITVAALEADPSTAELPVGVHWDAGTTHSGDTMAESYTWPDSGTGFASSPIATLFTKAWIAHKAHKSSVALDTNGVGFASSPILGFFEKLQIHLGGGVPGGHHSVTLLAMDGVGFSSSPIGLDAWDIWTPGGSTVDLPNAPFGGQSLGLSSGTISGVGLEGTALGTFWDDGGWSVSGQTQPTAAITGSGTLDAEALVVGTCTGDGYEPY